MKKMMKLLMKLLKRYLFKGKNAKRNRQNQKLPFVQKQIQEKLKLCLTKELCMIHVPSENIFLYQCCPAYGTYPGEMSICDATCQNQALFAR